MASNSGIQKLMEAERKAAQIVAEARKERTERLKSARNEAMKEIETFRYTLPSVVRHQFDCSHFCQITLTAAIYDSMIRAQKQRELDEMQQKMQAVNTSQSELQQETEQKIVDLQQMFKENVADSIQILLQKVGEVDVSVPDTYKQRGASARGN